MKDNPIIQEIRQRRQEYAGQLEYNPKAIQDDLKRRQLEHKDRVVALPPKLSRKTRTA